MHVWSNRVHRGRGRSWQGTRLSLSGQAERRLPEVQPHLLSDTCSVRPLSRSSLTDEPANILCHSGNLTTFTSAPALHADTAQARKQCRDARDSEHPRQLHLG